MATSEPAARTRLSAADWARAALSAIAEGGLAAVAVERLATRLRTTKGSFYWHFPNRDALVRAALELWEREHTEAIIAQTETAPDPVARLRWLFLTVTGADGPLRENQIEVALLANADDPAVAAVLARVTRRRIDYVARLFTQLGHDPAEARRRALLAFTAWLGHTQLVHAVPQALPTVAERPGYLEYVLDTLLA